MDDSDKPDKVTISHNQDTNLWEVGNLTVFGTLDEALDWCRSMDIRFDLRIKLTKVSEPNCRCKECKNVQSKDS